MLRAHARTNRRRGATMVEAAIALPIFFLLVFGTFEYGRYFMMVDLLNNAAREGARFAVVHTYDKTTTDVQNQVKNYLAGQQAQLQNFNVLVYSTDASGNSIPGSNWTNTPFGSSIGVQVDGDYQPILPAFLLLPGSIHLRAIAIMNSEAN